MISDWLIEMFETDLNKLKNELNQYADEKDIWVIKGDIKNSAGNLCLHLLGNLNHSVGHLIGNTGYQRNRDMEFSEKNVSRKELIDMIEETITIVRTYLPKLKDEDYFKDYPAKVGGRDRATGYALFYFANHFNYHLGQVNYHRRLVGRTRSN